MGFLSKDKSEVQSTDCLRVNYQLNIFNKVEIIIYSNWHTVNLQNYT